MPANADTMKNKKRGIKVVAVAAALVVAGGARVRLLDRRRFRHGLGRHRHERAITVNQTTPSPACTRVAPQGPGRQLHQPQHRARSTWPR